MDSRTAAHFLSRIGALLEVKGEHKFKARAYAGAARALIALDTDDLGPLVRSGELADTPGIGPATLSVVRELVETGESSYLARLQEGMPEGLADLMRVPGLGAAKIQVIHQALGVESVDDLERVALNGQLAELPKFGKKTAERILKGIEVLKRNTHLQRFPQAAIEAHLLLASIVKHPDVTRADIAGSVRRHNEVVADIDIVAECSANPVDVAASFSRVPGVRKAAIGAEPGSVDLRFVDGTHLDLHCVPRGDYGVALWRATGSSAHIESLKELANAKGVTLEGNSAFRKGKRISIADEEALFKALGLPWIPPEMREGMGEVEAAAAGTLPDVVVYDDLRGILHCHSEYSDGTSSIADMAEGARERGWSYIGISDHSEAAFYAGGLKRDGIARQ
ncbi:MAG TPA: helix-hairpin-helix domain-containing protein, partial [Gemmatimonadaceae bacterium]|nr:helix-hairpin-helix domain-containing protein [Gemmatimonadaceae bacterium]